MKRITNAQAIKNALDNESKLADEMKATALQIADIESKLDEVLESILDPCEGYPEPTHKTKTEITRQAEGLMQMLITEWYRQMNCQEAWND